MKSDKQIAANLISRNLLGRKVILTNTCSKKALGCQYTLLLQRFISVLKIDYLLSLNRTKSGCVSQLDDSKRVGSKFN